MESLSENDIDALIAEVNRSGKLTINLADMIKQSLEKISQDLRRQSFPTEPSEPSEPSAVSFGQSQGPEGQEEEGSTEEEERPGRRPLFGEESSSEAASEEGRQERDYGVRGWGYGPEQKYDKSRISRERMQEIRRNPLEFIEFVYQNRAFKLKPIGTIEPVPKRIYVGRNGSLYYYKTRDENSQKLNLADQTKIYLKRYQRQQCLGGRSQRAIGLAGYMDVSGTCLNRPPGAGAGAGAGVGGRITAARQSKTRPPGERNRRRDRRDRSRGEIPAASVTRSSSSSRHAAASRPKNNRTRTTSYSSYTSRRRRRYRK